MAYPTLLDNVSNNKLVSSIDPAAYTATADGSSVSLEGYNSATFMYSLGTITDGTFVVKLEESADNSTWTAIDAADLIGTATTMASDTNQRLGYRGGQPYVRAGMTVTGSPSTGAELCVSVLLGHPNHGAIDGNTNPIIT